MHSSAPYFAPFDEDFYALAHIAREALIKFTCATEAIPVEGKTASTPSFAQRKSRCRPEIGLLA